MPLTQKKIQDWEARTTDAEFFATCTDEEIKDFMRKFKQEEEPIDLGVRFIPFREEWNRRHPEQKMRTDVKFDQVPP